MGENSCTPYSKIMAAWELLHWSGVFLCMKLVILLHVVVSVITYIVTVVTGGRFREKVEAGRRVVLLITAHPDDECMFFAPFLLQSCPTSHVHVLCLTTGNYYGRGKLREKELVKSCQILGIPAENVTVINHRDFPDDPKVVWKAGSVESELCAAVDKIQPQQIFTFDDYGVSGHANHMAVSKAVRNIFQESKGFKGVEAVYYLESVSIWRKYLWVFDLPFTLFFSSNVCVLGPLDILRAQRAMVSHRSQLVWFRMLYIMVSRYMVLNSFRTEKCTVATHMEK